MQVRFASSWVNNGVKTAPHSWCYGETAFYQILGMCGLFPVAYMTWDVVCSSTRWLSVNRCATKPVYTQRDRFALWYLGILRYIAGTCIWVQSHSGPTFQASFSSKVYPGWWTSAWWPGWKSMLSYLSLYILAHIICSECICTCV